MLNFFSPYIRLMRADKPVGTLLLLLPCWFGVFLANHSGGSSQWHFLLLFAAGAFVMRSAGCVVNDIFDRKFDQKVARTKNRPLASGAIKLPQALILLALLLVAGFWILLQFNIYVIASGFVAVGLAACYPLMKRVTFYPQIFLGIAFNYGILMANLQLKENIDEPALLLYLACIIWTLIYDSIYAFQDIEDDLKIGVKSSAIILKKYPKQILLSLAVVMFALIYKVAVLAGLAAHNFIFLAIAFFYLVAIIFKTNYSNGPSCLKAFQENFLVGLLILFALI